MQKIRPLSTSAMEHVFGPLELTDINGLRFCGLFPKGREPSVRTLREWTRLRRIPYHRVGHFGYYDPAEVTAHIRTHLRVPARGEATGSGPTRRTGKSL